MKNFPPLTFHMPPLACPLQHSSLTPSSLNPLLLLLTLSLLSSFTSYAWDDDEEFDAPSRFTRNNSCIYSTSTKSLLQNEDLYSPKRLISPQQEYEADRASSIRVPSVQELSLIHI